MDNTTLTDIRDYFENQLKDGLQLEDVKRTVRFGIRRLVRYAFDFIPGEGAEKAESFSPLSLEDSFSWVH